MDRYSDGDREDLEWEEIFSGAADIRALELPSTIGDHLDTTVDATDAQSDNAYKPCDHFTAPSQASDCLHGLRHCHTDMRWCCSLDVRDAYDRP